MTDHRPEVREALEKALYCIEVQNMHSYDEQPDVETAIANGYWCKMAIDTRAAIKAALSTPPIEPVGVREALEAFIKAAQLSSGHTDWSYLIAYGKAALSQPPVEHPSLREAAQEFADHFDSIPMATQVVESWHKLKAALLAAEPPVVVWKEPR